MAMTPAIDVLLDARALLARPHGWTQGTYRAPMKGGGWSFCIEGSIDEAELRLGGLSGARERVRDVVGPDIPHYNDQPGRRQAEVLEVLDRAIAAEWHEDPLSRAPAQPSSDRMLAYRALMFPDAPPEPAESA